ncbi:hypothetical protein D3C81_2154430 [compost metagenome]
MKGPVALFPAVQVAGFCRRRQMSPQRTGRRSVFFVHLRVQQLVASQFDIFEADLTG